MIKSASNAREQRSLIFLHIPKTAGSTLNKIIGHQYKLSSTFTRHHYFPQEFNDEFKKLPEVRRKKVKVLRGHMFFGLHEYLYQPSDYITMLRDPVERVISYYYMILENPIHIFHKDITSRSMSLKDFAGSHLSDKEETLRNGQTRLLSGVQNMADSYENSSNDILELAKKNLKEHFVLAGLQDRFDETVLLLKKAFKWRNVFYIRIGGERPRPKKGDIPVETLRVIEKHNELDIELYRYAKEQFEEIIGRQGPSFEKELEVFRSRNKIYGKVYRNIYGIFRPAIKGFRRWLKTKQNVFSHTNTPPDR